MEKLENVLRSRTTNIQTAFQITILGHWWAPGDCQCFCIKACINKRKPRFYHYVWHILAWRRLLCSKSRRQRGAPPVPVAFTKEFVSYLNRIFFLLRSLFRSWFFHKQRASTCEFYKVHDVNRIWKLHENRALTWAVAAKINSPRIFSPVRKEGTFLIYQLLFENTLELTRLLLKISEYFFF